MTAGKSQPVLLKFEGEFDTAKATRIRDALDAVPPDVDVVVEFTHARSLKDFVLAVAFAGTKHVTPIAVPGLTEHQRRLLGYLGVPVRKRDE